MSSSFRLVIALLFGVLILIIFPFAIDISSSDSTPKVVVQMPHDAKPLVTLAPVQSPDTKIITQDRAVLWYTVFNKVISVTRPPIDGNDIQIAVRAANDAVDKAYGPHRP